MERLDAKGTLHRYLRTAREALVWKLDGLSEYDARRPLTTSGTNLLGIVKHLAIVEYGYFGDTFGRPYDEQFPADVQARVPNADMFATADETRTEILDLYRRATAHADDTIEALTLDDPGSVPWWPDDVNPVTLHWILVHMIAETNRHAGHADILREQVDGAIGLRADNANTPAVDADWWPTYVEQVELAARTAAARAGHGD